MPVIDINSKIQPAKAYWQDGIAGLSIAGLLLPEAVAYSSIANLPPQTGLIALFVGLICYGLFGNSRFAIVSATSSSAVVLAAATATLAGDNNILRLMLASGLVIITGLFFVIAGLARVDNITAFIAKPVLRGFAFGLAVVIVLKQCASIVGVHVNHSDILELFSALLSQIADWNQVSIAVGVVALGLLFLFARFRYLPGGLIVMGIGIAASHWLDLSNYGVSTIGTINLQISHPTLPALSRAEWLRLGELGFAMAMILYSESYGSIRYFAMKHGDSISSNRDLLALGMSNLVSGLFQGLPVGAGYSATSANEAAGANTRLAGGIAAVVVLAMVLTVLSSIALTPEPVLAAIVIHAVSPTLNPAIFRPYFVWRRDRLVMLTAVIGVLFLGVLDGLLIAIAISLIMMLRRFSESTTAVLGRLGESHNFVDMAVHPEARSIAGVVILRPDEPLFFANIDRILTQIRQTVAAAGPSISTVIISLEETPDLDSSSLEALLDFFESIAGEGKRLILARLKHPVHEILKQVAPPSLAAPIFSGLSVDDAVQIVQLNKHFE
ncbi:MAG: Sulfate permease, MFS superfamily [Candidatus Nitrotoga sp. SPKER]|nr:MAG: Sulfate permease, MFS superfamily [Candidatus Nitrotoga sp. SPKER]